MSELVFTRNGIAVTTSQLVAQGIDAEHRTVLQLIRKYVSDFEVFGDLIFESIKGKALPQGGFAKATEIAILNEPQTTLLLTFFKNTEIVRKFKVALVQKFYELRRQLSNKDQLTYEQALKIVEERRSAETDTITSEQQYEISSHVMRKTHALFGNRNYSAVYRALKRRFRIPRYTCLLNRDYETALKFIDNLTADDFSLPDMPEESEPATPVVLAKNAKFVTQACKFSFNAFSTCEKSLATVPAIPAIPAPASYSITESEMKAIKAMVYYFDDLFKPLIQWAEKEAFKQNHPLASRFYDVWHEPLWFLGQMKRIIERNNA